MYLFDTDAITNILKKKPSSKMLEKIGKVSKRQSNISTITLGEIIYGAFKSSNPDLHLKNLKEILLPMVNLVSFDSKAAYSLWKNKGRSGIRGVYHTSYRYPDRFYCLANDLALITGNIRHFSRIPGLK